MLRDRAAVAANIRPVEDRRSLAILMMLGAYLCFTALDSSAKWLVTAGMPLWQVVFVRYGIHLAIVAALFLPREGTALLATRHRGTEIARALALLGSTVCNFFAVRYLELTVTATIFFTLPIVVTVLSVIFLRETVGWRRWSAIAVGFCGILVVTRPWGAGFHWAMLVSLGTVLCASTYQILTRRLAGIDSTQTQQFYGAFVATLAVAPVAFLDWQWPADAVGWGGFALLGVFGWIGHQFLTVAHRYAPASVLAPFVYVQLLFMTASSVWIFGAALDPWVFAGAAIVIASGVYIWLRERRAQSTSSR